MPDQLLTDLMDRTMKTFDKSVVILGITMYEKFVSNISLRVTPSKTLRYLAHYELIVQVVRFLSLDEFAMLNLEHSNTCMLTRKLDQPKRSKVLLSI